MGISDCKGIDGGKTKRCIFRMSEVSPEGSAKRLIEKISILYYNFNIPASWRGTVQMYHS